MTCLTTTTQRSFKEKTANISFLGSNSQRPRKHFGAMDLETSFSLIQVSIQSETGGFLSP
jgi:hypothetical protein